jgi:hypothetical protein
MIRHRQETEAVIPGLGEFMSNFGAELAANSKVEEGAHYLELAVKEAKEMGNSNMVLFARELEYLKVKRKILSPQEATQKARNLLLISPSDNHTLEGKILLAMCLVSEKLVEEAANELEEIEAWNPITMETIGHQRNQQYLVALKISVAKALGESGDPENIAKSRDLLESLIELVVTAHEGHISKVMLGQQLFKLRFEVAEDRRDRCDVCRRLVQFEAADEIPFHAILGGVPQYWIDYLEELRDERQWGKLEDFSKTYTGFRMPLFDMLKYRARVRDNFGRIAYVQDMKPVQFGDNYADSIVGWLEMHDLLGQAQFHLGNIESAEQNFWTAFALHLFAAPWMTLTDMWKEHLHHLAACLHHQGQRRKELFEILLSSYSIPLSKAVDALGPVHQTFKSKKRKFGGNWDD